MKNSKRVYRQYGFAIDKSDGVWNIADRHGEIVSTAKTLALARVQIDKLLTVQLRAIVARNDAFGQGVLEGNLKEERHKHQWVFDSEIASGRRLSNGRQQLITRRKCPVCFKKTEWTYSAGGRIRRYYRP